MLKLASDTDKTMMIVMFNAVIFDFSEEKFRLDFMAGLPGVGKINRNQPG